MLRLVATTAGGASVLATHTDAPVVTETTVSTDLLEALEVLTELAVHVLGEDLEGLAGLPVTLSVEEPLRDLELERHLDDGDDALDLVRLELASALGALDLSLLADDVSETAADTADGGEGERDHAVTINVGVENTQNVLEVLRKHEARPAITNTELEILSQKCNLSQDKALPAAVARVRSVPSRRQLH